MSEYGSDTVEGLHMLPAFVWSEEFQTQQFSKHFEAFDTLRNDGFFIGEFVWNFADFKTAQSKFQLVSLLIIKSFPSHISLYASWWQQERSFHSKSSTESGSAFVKKTLFRARVRNRSFPR